MFLGLDVGGTHTDAVLVNESGVVASYKAVTDHNNLIRSVNKAIEEVTSGIDRNEIKRVNLSTTLSTNAIVEDKVEPVGVIVSAGPGIDPEEYNIGGNYGIIDGSIDHRGSEIKSLDNKQIQKIIKQFKKKKISLFAVATKFSTRNPDHENLIEDKLSSLSDYTTLGHKLSGQLSFPRRIATAYYNSAVWRISNKFADAIESSMSKMGINCQINVLKADGGTMTFKLSRKIPVETILSGPAASVMGLVAIGSITEDSVMLDIGGTTTDIAVFASGHPLIEKDGISLNNNPTLVRSLATESIGIGGDSIIKASKNGVTAGPERLGPAMAMGGDFPSLVDAINFLELIKCGDVDKSIRGLHDLAAIYELEPEKLATDALFFAVEEIKKAVDRIVKQINEMPVYTIHEMVDGKKIKPKKIYIMGGPARGFAGILAEKFGLEVVVPDNYQVANAIGAAVAKTTFDIELFADTSEGVLIIPNLDIRKKIPRSYTLQNAEEDARRYLSAYLENMGVGIQDIEIIESTSFKMVSEYFTTGRDIRVKCQVKPGIIMNIC